MKKTDGLTRDGRLERITSVRSPDAVDSDELSLLGRALEVAGWLRYYNLRGMSDGYFRELLPELERLSGLGNGPAPDECMEPAQALLYTFLHNLSEAAGAFNRRLGDLPRWYIDEIGGIDYLVPQPSTLWVALEKGVRQAVEVGCDTGFRLRSSPDAIFRPTDDMVLEDAVVRRVVAVRYMREGKLYPASALDCVTSVEVRELPDGEEGFLFADRHDLRWSQSPGFIVSSSALLLREGRRTIVLRLETESHAFADLLETARSSLAPEETTRLLTDLFYVEISTETGWKKIRRVHIAAGDGNPDNLTLRCTLPQEFPATAPCTDEIHGLDTPSPALKIYLNLDAWLYPYSWIREFVLKRIVVDVSVDGLTALAVYNDLGRIDNSKPFPPFGSGAERGAWFVVGSYEMAVKHTDSLDLHISWGQLPATSLYDHYRAYGVQIDNSSFRLDAHYLRDYRWHDIAGRETWSMFVSDPAGLPTAESTLSGIPLEKMPATMVGEQDYDYSIHSKTGFIRFTMTAPDMGFGEQRYRTLFSQRLLKKKGAVEELEPPITPLVERITADYRASDHIDLHECDARHDVGFWHIHPLGIRKVYPNRDRRSVPLIASVTGDAHLFFGLDGVQGGEYLRLWFDFAEMEREMDGCPAVRWFWGDGYDWRELPDDVILCDTTDNLSGAGMIGFDIPDIIDAALRDENGTLWFRATMVSGIAHVPVLRRIVPNAICLTAEGDIVDAGDDTVELQKPLPGVSDVQRLSAMAKGRSVEGPDEKMIRFSEHVTHRGRAVTARDYERLAMQEFPAIACAKCFPDMDTKGNRQGVVTVVVIPSTDREGSKGWRPRMTGRQIMEIERYLAQCASPAVAFVDVINPRYEEVLVRGMGEFRPGYSTGHCRARLKELCDRMIAPWQGSHQTPQLGSVLMYDEIAEAIRSQPYVASLEKLSLIRIVRRTDGGYTIEEFDSPGGELRPTVPYAIFVPAREHLFPPTGDVPFGIGEMAVGRQLVMTGNG